MNNRFKKPHINLADWDKCSGDINLAELVDVPCWGGLIIDPHVGHGALRMVWRVKGILKTWGKLYLPESALVAADKKTAQLYATGIAKGNLTLIPSPGLDFHFIQEDVYRLLTRFKVHGVGYDAWQIKATANRLRNRGIPAAEVSCTAAGLSAPMQEIDQLYKLGLLQHGGDALLRFNVSKVACRTDINQNMAPLRCKRLDNISGYEAMLIATALLLRGANGCQQSDAAAQSPDSPHPVYHQAAHPQGLPGDASANLSRNHPLSDVSAHLTGIQKAFARVAHAQIQQYADFLRLWSSDSPVGGCVGNTTIGEGRAVANSRPATRKDGAE